MPNFIKYSIATIFFSLTYLFLAVLTVGAAQPQPGGECKGMAIPNFSNGQATSLDNARNVGAMSSLGLSPDVPGDENWDSRFGLLGTDSVINAMVISGTDIFIGGGFSQVGGLITNHVARWDGEQWHSLADGVGGQTIGDGVQAMVVKDGNLYVAGHFGSAGVVQARSIGRWDGSQWHALGTGNANGITGFVHAMSVVGDDLYVGGDFQQAGGVTANYIARWDGSQWHPLVVGTDNGINREVDSMLTIGADLYVGGDFTTAGSLVANHIVRWNGSAWSTLGKGADNGLPYSVTALAADGDTLYTGGADFAIWDGTQWHDQEFFAYSFIRDIYLDGGDVYLGGDFLSIASPYRNIVRWNSGQYYSLGGVNNGVNGSVKSLVMLGNSLYLAGGFSTASYDSSRVAAYDITRWDGDEWFSLDDGHGMGLDRMVEAVAIRGTEVYVGGEFSQAGSIQASKVAKWDGTQWSSLGTGLSSGLVSDIAVNGSNIYIGGEFSTVGAVTARNIGYWNGNQWHSLGTGSENGVNGRVETIAISGSSIYAGGNFDRAGSVVVSNIAVWNGSGWAPLGEGVNGRVHALLVVGDDLYVGGSFTVAGDVIANHIAKWDGSQWSALGTGANNGVNGSVFALTYLGGQLYAGGSFNNANGVVANHVARWDGSQWAALGSGQSNGTNQAVHALVVNESELYVGGDGAFHLEDGTTTESIAKWDGNRWSALGSGVGKIGGGGIRDFAFIGRDILVGGQFGTVGDKPSQQFAIYHIPACSISFSDVPPASTFYPFVRCLACQGVLGGYTDGTFRPGNSITRGQISKVVSNAAGFNEGHTEQTFEDVPAGSTFHLVVERMASRGIIGGYPCSGPGEPCVAPNNRPYFRLNANATRGQIAKIVATTRGWIDPATTQRFEDVPAGSTFYLWVENLASRGVMQGYQCSGPGEPCVAPNNRPYFRPGVTATRGQVSKIVSNAFFPDCQLR